MDGPVYVGGDESDTLYYAAKNDLGFLVRQSNHEYRKISRVHLLSASQRTISPTAYAIEGDHMVFTSVHGSYLISRSRTEFLPDKKTPMMQHGTDTVLFRKLVRQMGD